jgi:phosphoenolpyruvate carboxykinase (GTP)
VLRWIIDRCKGSAKARETAIGHLPNPGDLDVQGLDMGPGALDELLTVDPKLWQQELAGIGEYLRGFGDRVPRSLAAELESTLEQVRASQG